MMYVAGTASCTTSAMMPAGCWHIPGEYWRVVESYGVEPYHPVVLEVKGLDLICHVDHASCNSYCHALLNKT
jgi:hypothetical protein